MRSADLPKHLIPRNAEGAPSPHVLIEPFGPSINLRALCLRERYVLWCLAQAIPERADEVELFRS